MDFHCHSIVFNCCSDGGCFVFLSVRLNFCSFAQNFHKCLSKITIWMILFCSIVMYVFGLGKFFHFFGYQMIVHCQKVSLLGVHRCHRCQPLLELLCLYQLMKLILLQVIRLLSLEQSIDFLKKVLVSIFVALWFLNLFVAV